MGIPKFFKWMNDSGLFKDAIISSLPSSVDLFAIDMNALVYDNLSPLMIETIRSEGLLRFSTEEFNKRKLKVFNGVLSDIIGMVRTVKPKYTLLLAFDGVAPQAKIAQQRNRRYLAQRKPEDVFDKNSISPGTEFMFDLDQFLRDSINNIQQGRSMLNNFFPPRVIYSSHLGHGEGEHKIAKYMTSLPDKNQVVVINGMDADLIMIYLLRLREGWTNIYLFRNKTKRNQVLTAIDLRAMEKVITTLYPKVPDPVNDFVTVLFLIGNDFLPHFPSFERIEDALTALVYGYRDYSNEYSEGVTDGMFINLLEFQGFLRYILDTSEPALLRKWAENSDGVIRICSSASEKCITTTRVFENDRAYTVRKFNASAFRDAWYSHALGPKDRPMPGGNVYSEADIRDMCVRYMEGIVWVHKYYFDESGVNLGWTYPYSYAPLFSDVAKLPVLVRADVEFHTIDSSSIPISPLEQLVMILPPSSIAAVPPEIKDLYKETSPVYDLLPSTHLVDSQGKMEDWEAIALLPYVNRTRVINAVRSLKLPPQVLQKYANKGWEVFSKGVMLTGKRAVPFRRTIK